jgi:hypothetical protein
MIGELRAISICRLHIVCWFRLIFTSNKSDRLR